LTCIKLMTLISGQKTRIFEQVIMSRLNWNPLIISKLQDVYESLVCKLRIHEKLGNSAATHQGKLDSVTVLKKGGTFSS
jgi:hypothetical protein